MCLGVRGGRDGKKSNWKKKVCMSVEYRKRKKKDTVRRKILPATTRILSKILIMRILHPG